MDKHIAIAIAVVAVLFLVGGSLFSGLFPITNNEDIIVQEPTTQPPADDSELLEITDVQEGTGAEARPGTVVTVHYVGTLENGQKFDSSRDRGEPFQFVLGTRQVIEGWDKGVVGMKEGGIRTLKIAPEMAYGPNGISGVIPPNATLLFEVELLEVSAS